MKALRITALALWAPLALACGGAQSAAPSEYGYGDMFANDDRSEMSYRGGGGGMAESVAVEEYSRSTTADMPEEEPEMMAPAEAPPSRSFGGRRGRSRSAPPPPPSPVVQAAPVSPSDGESPDLGPQPEPTPSPAQTTETSQGEEGGEEGAAPATARRGPMLIYEAALRLATRQELSEQIDLVSAYAISIGGFVVTQDDASIVVRVPAGRFREALDHLETLGDVVGRRISAMDVSEQVRDLRVRLQNAINLRDRLMELLEQATTVAESLVIEHELERLNEQIALMRGTLEGLEERVSFSTITVNFQPVQDHREVPNELFRLPFSWLDELGLQHLLIL